MPTLPDLTHFVTFHSAAAEEHLWELFSAQVYALLLKAEKDSLLVRVRQRFSLHEAVTACEGYHRYAASVGRPASYPVLRLCWALLLRYLFRWSLRTLEQQLRVNLLVRWCTNFTLHEPTPDHTTLARFESWVQEHALDVFFVVVLRQIDGDFPDNAHTLLCGDTFGMQARAADVSLNTLLRQSCRHLLLALEAALPLAHADCVAQLDLSTLFGADDERPEQQLSSADREARTLVTAQAVQTCLALVQQVTPLAAGCDTAPSPALVNLHHWRDVTAKILKDEFTDKPLPPPKSTRRKADKDQTPVVEQPVVEQPVVEQPVVEQTAAPGQAPAASTADAIGSAGQAPAAVPTPTPQATSPLASQPSAAPASWTDVAAAPSAPATPASAPTARTLRRCTDAELGSYRIVSATDTDATIRKHGGSVIIGYNAALLASTHFVRGTHAHTGATPDGATVAPSIATHLERFGFAPQRAVYDRAAGTLKHMADVRRASNGQTQLVARQINYGQRHARFSPADFTLEGGALTCPNGVTVTRAYRAGDADGFDFRFLASECQGCPLWQQCRDPNSKPDSPRNVFISDYALLFRDELAYLDTPDAKSDFSFRANVERHIAALTLHNGARHAQSTGLRSVNFQLSMAATAYNLKRWHTLTLEQERLAHKERPPP